MSAALEFDEARHEYRYAGRIVPSVTQVIGFLNDYAGVPRDALDLARERGNAVHLATALDDRDNLDEESVDPVVAPYLNAWRQLRADLGFEPELIEHRVYSVTHGYAGALDRFGKFRHRPNKALIDIKATAVIMPGNGPQTAAYKAALTERAPCAVDRYTVLLCPDRSPPYRLQPHRDATDLTMFVCALNLHNWRLNNGYKGETS